MRVGARGQVETLLRRLGAELVGRLGGLVTWAASRASIAIGAGAASVVDSRAGTVTRVAG